VGFAFLFLCFGSAAFASDESPRHFDVKAKPLGEALMDFGVQSGLTIAAPTSLTAGKKGSSLNGDMASTDALRILLAGTGLTFARGDDGAIAIEKSENTVTVRNSTAKSNLEKDLTPGIGLAEIVVTATRKEESLSKVPISVSAFSREEMDSKGVRRLDDLVRLTPGLSMSPASLSGAQTVAIRGVSSAAGSGTTGIYIDDTPIQVRNLGLGAGTAFPGLFDIERVEVLRGPQGTLFGAGSEGGTIRFITAQPSLHEYSSYARAEIGNTEEGDISYEGGAAFGGPIVADRLGFRLSAFYRREGGFIDAVNGNYTVLDPTGAAYGNSVAFTPTQTVEKDINWSRTVAVRGALEWAATDSLTVTPSVFYQKHHVNEGQGATYWLSQSDIGARNYSRPSYFAGNPATDPALTAMNAPQNQLGDDAFSLSALVVNWDLGPVQLISNTSFFHRDNVQWFDYTQGYITFYNNALFPNGAYPPPGWKAMSAYNNGQRNFVQEIRLQSTNSQSRISWVAGVFFAHDKQTAEQPIHVNFLAHAPYVGFSPGFAGYTDGPPYGPGSSAYENFLGADLWPNSTSWYAKWGTVDKQVAAFAQADFGLTSRLKLTTGLRFSRTKLDYNAQFGAPENNANAPFGLPCVPGTYCADPADFIPPGTYAVGTGPFTPSYASSIAHSSETATTPKVGLEYQLNDTNMLYATAAKGFRPAGANLQLPAICGSDLATFGYANAQGHSTEPVTYGSDNVWSYELGSKNRLLDGRLVLDGSVYVVKWKNIQTRVFLPNCAYDFVDNLADATSRGFDLGFRAKPFASLTLRGALGYNKATFDRDANSPGGVTIYQKAGAIPDAGAPWTLSLSPEYEFSLFGGRNFYLRADYTYTTADRPVGPQVPGTPQYDSLLRPAPAYSMVNARLGARLMGLDVSLFVNNLTDSAPLLIGAAHSIVYDPQDWTPQALRPRTYGLTLTYRN
jgi:outer membrane receptor protein involved in Fe transport